MRIRAFVLALLAPSLAFAQPCPTGTDDALGRLLADLGDLECGPIAAKDIPVAEWTFYVHMAADNDLAPFGALDIAEMSRAGSSPGRTNVFVLADGPSSWGPARLLWMPPAGSGCGPREVIVDGPLARHLAEPNLGDPQVLRDALSFLTSNVPAKHFFLDLWNHGDGWRGIGFDDSGDHLDFASGELEQAIEGFEVDVLGADACLTATVEVAIAAHEVGRPSLRESIDRNRKPLPRVRALVASQELEPGHGWNYEDLLPRIAAAIQPGEDTPIFDVVSEAVRSYETTGAATLSATDLEMAGYAFDDIGKLAHSILEAGGLSGNPALRDAYERSLRFGTSGELMDLADFGRRIAATHDGDLRWLGLKVASTVNAATVHGTGLPGRYSNARGLSIYAPRTGVDPQWTRGPWASDWLDSWAEVLESYHAEPRTGVVMPEWYRRSSGTRPPDRLESTSWAERRRLPVAMHFAAAFGYEHGVLEVNWGGHSTTGTVRIASAALEHATRTLRIQLEPGEAAGPASEYADRPYSGTVRYKAPGDGVWTIVFEHDGVELGRTEWWDRK